MKKAKWKMTPARKAAYKAMSKARKGAQPKKKAHWTANGGVDIPLTSIPGGRKPPKRIVRKAGVRVIETPAAQEGIATLEVVRLRAEVGHLRALLTHYLLEMGS